MKRTLFLLTLLLIVTGNIWAQRSFSVGSITYEVTSEENKEVVVYFISDQSLTSVDIPATVVDRKNERYSVIGINPTAFFCKKSVKQITLPNSITCIGDNVFWGCESLAQITLPNSVTSIGEFAFMNCKSLTQITIPNSVTSIGESAFSGCKSLKQITLPNSITSIGNNVFYNCESLTQIALSDRVTDIGSGMFLGCKSLTNITIPSSVKNMGKVVLGSRTNVKKLIVNAIVPPKINDATFGDCPPALQVYVPARALETYKAAEGWRDLNLNAIEPKNKTVRKNVGLSFY